MITCFPDAVQLKSFFVHTLNAFSLEIDSKLDGKSVSWNMEAEKKSIGSVATAISQHEKIVFQCRWKMCGDSHNVRHQTFPNWLEKEKSRRWLCNSLWHTFSHFSFALFHFFLFMTEYFFSVNLKALKRVVEQREVAQKWEERLEEKFSKGLKTFRCVCVRGKDDDPSTN